MNNDIQINKIRWLYQFGFLDTLGILGISESEAYMICHPLMCPYVPLHPVNYLDKPKINNKWIIVTNFIKKMLE